MKLGLGTYRPRENAIDKDDTKGSHERVLIGCEKCQDDDLKETMLEILPLLSNLKRLRNHAGL